MPEKEMAMTAWYLKKKQGKIYGPIDLETLAAWAGEGRISPDDLVSDDQKKWKPAPALSSLKMVWSIQLNDGSNIGPLNILSTCEHINDGSISLDDQATHLESGEEKTVREALLRQLMQEWEAFRAQADHWEAECRKLHQELEEKEEHSRVLSEQLEAQRHHAAAADDMHKQLAEAEEHKEALRTENVSLKEKLQALCDKHDELVRQTEELRAKKTPPPPEQTASPVAPAPHPVVRAAANALKQQKQSTPGGQVSRSRKSAAGARSISSRRKSGVPPMRGGKF